MNLEELRTKLANEIPEYEFTFKKRFGREVIIGKKDIFRGVEIFKSENGLDILPMIPTTKGKLLFGSGINWAKKLVKNYSEVGDRVYEHLLSQDLGIEIKKISEIEEISQTEKGRKNDGYALVFLGVLSIGLGLFLFNELKNIETEGGELNIHWMLVFLYENLGKEVIVGMFGLLGVYYIYDGIKKVKESGAQ